jgi:hypothetical protein
MARAIEWATTRPSANGGSIAIVNTGSDAWTLREVEIANAVAAEIPGVTVTIDREAPADRRSCKVDFSLFRRLAPLHQPREKAAPSILELKSTLEAYFADRGSDRSSLMRSRVLSGLVERGRLNANLTWARLPLPGPEVFPFAMAGRA